MLEIDVTVARPAAGGRRPLWPIAGTVSTACSTPSASRRPTAWAARCSRADWDDVADGAPRLDLLAQGARRGVPAAARPRPERTAGRRWSALDFDATVAWPVYDWMGVAKAALESLSRYLARDLGPRGDPGQPGGGRPGPDHGGQVDPGLLRASRTPGRERAPLGWDVHDAEPVARACVALCRDWFPMTTGEILHVDGGVHAVGGSA